jgi:hypothetical protein
MPNIKVEANAPQGRFLPLPHKFRAFVGGFGSSKTYTGCMAMCKNFWEFPGVNQGYFAPTYPQIRDIFYPTIEEVAFSFGMSVEIKQTTHEVAFYSGRQYRGTTICRSMDKPGNIIGFKIGNALIDELDTLPTNKAEEAWNKIIARLRHNAPGVKNGIDVASTPEGFRFCHKKFVQALSDNPELQKTHALVQASTYENAKHLPAAYIPSLIEAYPKELIEAYLMGKFVNLTAGTVIRQYDRIRCNSTETIQEGEPLLIGQDFNTQRMASCVFVQRASGWHAVAELKDLFDTPAVIKIINERWRDKGHRIIIYPDASGASRKSVDASKSDIGLLEQAGYAIRVNPSNPAVKDRILATNKALENGKVKVNARECPTTARCLEQLAYDVNGEPDKTTGFDHSVDAFSYPIAYEMPVIRPLARMKITGI